MTTLQDRLEGNFSEMRSLPTKNGPAIQIEAQALRKDRAEWWHENVQPLIDGDPSCGQRADRHWNWKRIYWSGVLAKNVLGQHIQMVELVAKGSPGDNAQDRPTLGLLIVAFNYRHPYPRISSCPFAWYFSDAPAVAFPGVIKCHHPPKMIATALLDWVVTNSFRTLDLGICFLHADQAGGANLVQWYESKGMSKIPEGLRIGGALRRTLATNDGRYYTFLGGSALTFSQGNDGHR